MLKKMVASLNIMIMMLLTSTTVKAESNVLGNEEYDSIGDFISMIIDKVMPIAKDFMWLIIFVAVVMIGFEVIKHRNDEEKRKGALVSLLWIAVGAFIIGSAVVLTTIIYKVGQN